MKKFAYRLIIAIVMLITCVFFFFGISSIYRVTTISLNKTKVLGKIIHASDKYSCAKMYGECRNYTAIFKSQNRKEFTVSQDFLKEDAYRIGQDIPVIYDKSNPGNAVFEVSFTRVMWTDGFLALAGAIIFGTHLSNILVNHQDKWR